MVAVFTGEDMTGVNSLPCGWDLRKDKNIPGVVQDLVMVPHMPLTSDVARHVGDPVAVVIADSQDAAIDAAELVAVDWERAALGDGDRPRPAQTGAAPDPRGRARATSRSSGSSGAATSTPPSRAPTSSSRSASSTSGWSPTRWSRGPASRATRSPRGELTLWVTSQNPHVHRLLMCAFVLGIPEHKVRVIAPDVGGGFGSKIFLYNEEVVCSWASRQIKRPIRWTARPAVRRT